MGLVMNHLELEQVGYQIDDARYLVAMIELVAESGNEEDVRFKRAIQKTAIEIGDKLKALSKELDRMVEAAPPSRAEPHLREVAA